MHCNSLENTHEPNSQISEIDNPKDTLSKTYIKTKIDNAIK